MNEVLVVAARTLGGAKLLDASDLSTCPLGAIRISTKFVRGS